MQVETQYFGIEELADGELLVADGGTHGVPGHRLLIRRDGSAEWSRHTGSFRPTGPEGAGTVELESRELGAVERWTFDLTTIELVAPPLASPPRWVFVVARCRGNHVAVVEGGGLSHQDAPEGLADLLAWLRRRVDAAAGA